MTAAASGTSSTDQAGSRATIVVRDGLIAGVVAAVATTLIAVIAKAAGVPLEAAPQTDPGPQELPILAFAQGTLMATVVGILIALALARWAPRPAAWFVAITVVLTVVSLAGPITTGHATTATRLVLELTHVVAAVIIIPAIARRLPARRA